MFSFVFNGVFCFFLVLFYFCLYLAHVYSFCKLAIQDWHSYFTCCIRCGFSRASIMSLVHPLSTRNASEFYNCFDGELYFPYSLLFVSCVKWTQTLVDVWKYWTWGALKKGVLWSLMYYINLSSVVTCDAHWFPHFWDNDPLDWWWEKSWSLVPSFPYIFLPCCLIGCL